MSTRQHLKHLVKSRLGPAIAARQPSRIDLPLATWGLAIGPNGHLWSGGVDLADIAAEHGTPVHVVLAHALDANASDALGTSDRSNGTDVFYSYKTNPVPAVLRRLHDHGIGAEVISAYELWLALRLGVPPDRIIYNGPAKSVDSLRSAIDVGVLSVNANSLSEAALITSLAEQAGRRVNLGLRLALTGTWAGQFGIDPSTERLAEAIRRASQHPSVNLRTLHVHRGVTIRTASALVGYVASVLKGCDTVRATTGWHPEILDVGGSLACPTAAPIPSRQFRLHRALGTDLIPPDPSECITLSDAAATIATMVDDHFRSLGLPVPRVVQEPGRALTANTQLLLTKVIDVKEDGGIPHAVLDAGMNIAEPVPNEYHQLFSATSPEQPAARSYRLAGPICTPADVLYQHWKLPDLTPGHVLAIMDTGAYFVPFSTAFSFPRPAIVLQDGPSVATVRRAETFDDLVAYDAVPGCLP